MSHFLSHQWCFVTTVIQGHVRPLYFQCFRCGLAQLEPNNDACFVIGYIADMYQWENIEICVTK